MSHQQHTSHGHDHHGHGHAHGPQQPAIPAAEDVAAHALDAAHPHVPDALVAPSAAATPGTMTPGARAHFVETLQSKKSWDALIHGSWV